MAFRYLTKTFLGGGTLYIFYDSGLWRSTDETIENYDRFKKDVNATIDLIPNARGFITCTSKHISNTMAPVTQSVSDFRKEWLNFDMSWMNSFNSEDGIVKPAWNKGVLFTTRFLANAPENIKSLTGQGWQKMTGMINETGQEHTIVIETKSSSNEPSHETQKH